MSLPYLLLMLLSHLHLCNLHRHSQPGSNMLLSAAHVMIWIRNVRGCRVIGPLSSLKEFPCFDRTVSREIRNKENRSVSTPTWGMSRCYQNFSSDVCPSVWLQSRLLTGNSQQCAPLIWMPRVAPSPEVKPVFDAVGDLTGQSPHSEDHVQVISLMYGPICLMFTAALINQRGAPVASEQPHLIDYFHLEMHIYTPDYKSHLENDF